MEKFIHDAVTLNGKPAKRATSRALIGRLAERDLIVTGQRERGRGAS